MRFVDAFSAILLDMNGTFVFGHDRFGPGEDYGATYRALGGKRLDQDRVQAIVRAAFEGMKRDYNLPGRYDDFPSVEEALRLHARAPEEEIPILERVFAAHEMGQVPPGHGEFLRRMAATHHLGIASNLWARPEPWLEMLERTRLLSLFTAMHFSSEGRSIKPSRRFFERVLGLLPSGGRVLFAGDSLERDILPAKALGLATAWIAPAGSTHPAADVVVESLPDLRTLRQ